MWRHLPKAFQSFPHPCEEIGFAQRNILPKYNFNKLEIFQIINHQKYISVKAHIFTTHEVTSFLQEQHPFPQTLHLVDNPTIPGIWINDEVQYFAVPRREGSRALFCWKFTIPGSPHISTLLGKDATTGSCFHHPVHQNSSSFAEWHFDHI